MGYKWNPITERLERVTGAGSFNAISVITDGELNWGTNLSASIVKVPFAFFKSTSSTWPTGADGALSINGTVVTLLAGSVKDYSSISIINNGELRIINNLSGGNGGNDPTIIGCSGNCTINTGGQITLRRNALRSTDSGPGNFSYSVSTPAGAAIPTVSYQISHSGEGGGGGNGLASGGSDSAGYWGHGGGGGGLDDGGSPTSYVSGWGISGDGGDNSIGSGRTGGISAYDYGFSYEGNPGAQAESGDPCMGGGGSGGTRGLFGGCLYLQVAGTISVSGTVFYAGGDGGGNGGPGGPAGTEALTLDAYGGGGGGGGNGGSGGKIIIRYKLGTVNAGNCSVAGGIGGLGGIGGYANGLLTANAGIDGSPGTDGNNGSTDIATY